MITKYLIPIVAVLGFGGGSFFGAKLLAKKCPPCELRCPEIPDCNCPAAVELQSFDLSKLNNKKGSFVYSPQLHDVTIRIEAKDSVLIKQMLRMAN